MAECLECRHAVALTLKSSRGHLVQCSIAAALVLFVASCASDADAENVSLMEYPVGSGGVVALDDTKPGESYAFDDIVTCVNGEGSVRVVDVELIEAAGDIRVVTYSTLPANTEGLLGHLTDPRESLSGAGYPASGPLIISARCPERIDTPPEEGRGYAVIGIEFARGSASASTRGVRIIYESGDAIRSVDYPLGIVLCDDLFPERLNGEVNPRCEIVQLEMG